MQRTFVQQICPKLHLHHHEGTRVVVDTRNFIDTSSRNSRQDCVIHTFRKERKRLNLIDQDHEKQGLHSLYFHLLTNEKNYSW